MGLYYALRRNADGMVNEKTGKFDGISSVYRIKFSSAFVVDPDRPMDIPKLALDEERMQAFRAIKANTIKGIETLVPQLVPPGTSEFGAGITEGLVEDLPSKDFFLTTLHRHCPANEDKERHPALADRAQTGRRRNQHRRRKRQQPQQQPGKAQQQVRNEDPPLK